MDLLRCHCFRKFSCASGRCIVSSCLVGLASFLIAVKTLICFFNKERRSKQQSVFSRQTHLFTRDFPRFLRFIQLTKWKLQRRLLVTPMLMWASFPVNDQDLMGTRASLVTTTLTTTILPLRKTSIKCVQCAQPACFTSHAITPSHTYHHTHTHTLSL